MKHVMVDLETLGTVPGCTILSIGAVEFDAVTGKLGDEFYIVIGTESCEELYLTTSADTVAWWRKQSEAAREVLGAAADPKRSTALRPALEAFNDYLKGIGTAKDVRLYGNGADFDNPILACAYDVAGIKPEWASYNGRCYRTLKNLHELLGEGARAPKLERQGTYHNALADAKSQAQHLIAIVRSIRQ